MAIGEQFAGLNMEQLIGGPLSAAAASVPTAPTPEALTILPNIMWM